MIAPKNTDPFRVWNNPMHDGPFAPHNGFDADNPFKPWNEPFGTEDDLTNDERKAYGLERKKNSWDEEEDDCY
jgi:hypothetical protein